MSWPKRVRALSATRVPQRSSRKKAEEQRQPADQPPFLGHGGKDEVGVAFGQIVEVALRSVEEALAADAARPDRDLRLADVIAGAERIAFGVEEDQHALLLIVVEEREQHGQRRGAGDRGAAEPPEGQAGDEHHHHAADTDRQRGAKVGLQHDQRHGHADHQQRRP